MIMCVNALLGRQSIHRILKELKELRNAKYLEEAMEEESIDKIILKLNGPQRSPYANDTFLLIVQFPKRFPFEPPHLHFHPSTTPYHPNIDEEGRICLDLLKLPPHGCWRPTINMVGVMEAISLLLEEPNPDDPLVPGIAKEYLENRELFRLKAASKSAVKVPLNENKIEKTTEGGYLATSLLKKRKCT